MKFKLLAVLLCLAMLLTVAMPGTWAVSAGSSSGGAVVSVETAPVEETQESTEAPADPSEETTLPTQPEETQPAESTEPTASSQPVEEPTCTCNTEADIHAEGCPLYVTPGDSETDHEDVPSDSVKTKADLFYDAVMMAESEEALTEILSQYSTEEISALLDAMDEEKQNAIYAHVAQLYPSESVPDYSGIASTEAAPFLEPVQIASFFSARSEEQEESGLILDKTATYDADTNTFKVSLEAFVTGEVTISDIEVAVPTDIVLVLDSSGSMKDYITIGNKNDLSVLDTKYGGEDGMYELDDQVGLTEAWPNMVYKDGKWYYHKWVWILGRPVYTDDLIEVGSEENYSSGINIRIKKINALKIAAQRFVDQVNAKNTDADGNVIGHQIAVVDFDSNGTTVIGLTSVASGETTIKNAIKGLDAEGATAADYGMTRATEILGTIPATRKSNRVVIMFTDGEPNHQSGFDTSVANSTIKAAQTIKADANNGGYGATVYTIGVFESDKLDTTVPMPNSASNLNKYMHYVSSNFKNAEGMSKGNDPTYPKTGSYYLGATDATQLNEIFQSIADQIQTGGASLSLDASTVVKDVVSPQFTSPANSSEVQIYTAPYQGYDDDGERDFGDKVKSSLTATIADDGSIQVSGFDFSSDENCVTDTTTNGSTSYSGNKLIIEFTIKAKDGFLGGNDVFTNAEANVTNGSFSQKFPEPTVNVPIQDITVTAADKNVYLLGGLSADQIKAGATVRCGNVALDLSAENYGLASWQTEYVNISVSYTDASGNPLTTLSSLKADTTYSITVTVSPKTDGSTTIEGKIAETQSSVAHGNICVFTPELTFKDSQVYYGDNAPTDYSGNKTNEVWMHGETLDSAVTMIGTKPTLVLTYTPEAGKIVDNKIASKQDIAVDVAVKIGQTDVGTFTTFHHTDCADITCGTPNNGKFWLHVKTCQLTITKAAGTNTTIGNDEYFVFNISKDGQPYTQVTIQGTGSVTIRELPVGNYTVKEDASTAWRYSEKNITGSGNLTSSNPNGTITCTNGNRNDKWLNHFARVINTYGTTTQN